MPKATRRDRYIAFEFSDPRLGREVAAAFRSSVASWPKEGRPQLLFIEGHRGLARCGHLQKEDVVRLLNGLRLPDETASVRTVGTSGTIRRAKLRYFAKR